jgi:ribosomal protein S21
VVYVPVVIATPGESADSVIKKFTRKVMMEGILIDANMKKFYVKKGLRRKMKAIAKRKRFV